MSEVSEVSWPWTWAPSRLAPGQGRRMRSSFRELAAWIADAPPWTRPKGDLPLFSPATFRGDHRLAANVEHVSMLVFDIDAKNQPQPWDAARLEGLCADLLAGVAWLGKSVV